MAEKVLKLLLLPPATPLWAPCNRPPRLNPRKKESKKKQLATAKANLKKALAAPKKANPKKAALAVLKKEKATKENAARRLDAQAIPRRKVPVLKPKARAVVAAQERARELAVLAKPTQKEIAKNNTELFTTVQAHACMCLAQFRESRALARIYLPT